MIILASKSPRRHELMKYITEDFIIKSADTDETLPKGISPEDAVLRLSAIKAEPFRSENDIVIGADTVVALGKKILGKPKNDEDARRMLRSLSGKTHSVYTGVTIIRSQNSVSFAVQTKVTFYELTDKDIDAYIKTGEHRDKAGSYGIQGYGSLFVKEIKGDYFNVVGLPIGRLNKELKKIL